MWIIIGSHTQGLEEPGRQRVWTIQIWILNFVANAQSYDPYFHEQNVEVYDEFSKFKIEKPERI